MPQRQGLKNNCGSFSHCNPVFPEKGLWEGDCFLYNYATLLRHSCSSSRTGAPLSLHSCRSLCRLLGKTSRAAQWSLSCINYLKYQTPPKRAVALFVWLWWSEGFLAKLRDIWEDVFEGSGVNFVSVRFYIYHNLSDRKFLSLLHNKERQNSQFLRRKKVQHLISVIKVRIYGTKSIILFCYIYAEADISPS